MWEQTVNDGQVLNYPKSKQNLPFHSEGHVQREHGACVNLEYIQHDAVWLTGLVRWFTILSMCLNRVLLRIHYVGYPGYSFTKIVKPPGENKYKEEINSETNAVKHNHPVIGN